MEKIVVDRHDPSLNCERGANMFEPVPSYALFKEKNSRKANKNAIDQLNKFIPRVASYFQKYNIAYENRFQCILDICTSLGTLLDEKGPKIWPEGSKEPTDEFENIFQLLIYALGDCGLLYDSYGVWIGYRSSQNTDDLCDAWEVSEDVYHRLAFAMRNRDYTYRQIYKLRRDLKAHHNQTSWDEQAINYKGTPTKTGMFYLIRQLQNRKIIQDEKTISDAVTNLFSDRLLLPYGPLFLFFALWEPNFSTEMFRERLIQNCSRFPKAKKRPNAKSKQGPKLEPRDLRIMQEDCERYLQLEAIFQNTPRLLDAPTDILWMEFDPFLILRYLETKISITDEQKSIIANNTLPINEQI